MPPHDDQLPYDSFLLVSFGGPESPEDVLPFLENVLRGRNVPRERMLEVAEHYYHFGGKSPINDQNRALMTAIEKQFRASGIDLPIYWGNRNWHPMLPDTLRQMTADGRKRAIAYFTSHFSCYSGCRQYRENIADAQTAVGPGAPRVEKLRYPFNHPGFIGAMADRLSDALATIPASERAATPLLFTAHSIPQAMADGSRYEKQLRESCQLVAQAAGHPSWELTFQSRSGPPTQPWLEPDIGERIEALHSQSPLTHVLVAPIGFVSDHMEVLYDLDSEVADRCKSLGISLHRVGTVGTHPAYVKMIVDLIIERMTPGADKPALGSMGPSHDVCPENCCQYVVRRPPIAALETPTP
jgi:protoporphyrin/coproporphyrin ferrochelatase